MVYFRRSPLFYHPLLHFATPYSSNCKAKRCVGASQYRRRDQFHVDDTDETSTIAIDFPGVKSSDIKVQFHDGVLTVETERKSNDTTTIKRTHQFLIRRNNIDHDNFQANFTDGVLTVTVPKKASEATPVPISNEYPTERPADDESEIRFTVDLPGVKASDLKLQVQYDSLTLHAERSYGSRVSSIDKHFTFDENRVDANSFKAFLADGVLTVTGQRKEAPSPLAIPVSSGAPEATDTDTEPKDEKPLSSAPADEEDTKGADVVVTDTDAAVVIGNASTSKADDFVVVETVDEN